jgi:hypothetical protein
MPGFSKAGKKIIHDATTAKNFIGRKGGMLMPHDLLFCGKTLI